MSRCTDRIAAAMERDDRPACDVANAVTLALHPTGTAAKPIQNALHGPRLDHPLHPVLATLPFGSWTLACAPDCAEVVGRGDRGTRRAADIAPKAGTGGAGATATAGMADWGQIHGRDRRTGLVHAAVNATTRVLNLGSLALRRSRPATCASATVRSRSGACRSRATRR